MSSIAHTQQVLVASESSPHLHLASSLPPEILGEIFLRCIPPLIYHRGLRAHFPFNLTHVCSHWRVSALAFSELWSFLDVEQTRLNEQDRSRTLRLMKAYLERSGQHPLSFRLSCDPFDQMGEQPLLECLSGHSMRWQTVVIEGASQFTLDYLERSKPSDYSSLRSLDFFHCQLDSFDTSLPPFPWSHLSRYHEYDVSWYRGRDSVDQWSIVTQLTNVVDLRAAFDETFNGSRPIKMPRLRFASLAVSQVDEMLSCFEFPGIQGLNLMLTTNQPPRTLRSVPVQLKGLRILRLSGDLGVTIAKTALLCLLAELTELTDFAMALRGTHGVDATYLFTLLTPGRSLLVPRLQALRVATL
ncbi:hypothetical protein B0H14DRAFT_1469579 [Mycena olivaceomarginata]|nr:hypothetical protein B0H14DRAFT_1469579 [Mycena olivaceomarginata]